MLSQNSCVFLLLSGERKDLLVLDADKGELLRSHQGVGRDGGALAMPPLPGRKRLEQTLMPYLHALSCQKHPNVGGEVSPP